MAKESEMAGKKEALEVALQSIEKQFGKGAIMRMGGEQLANVEIIPTLPPFDPFPFGLLTMAVSLEAIVLSVVILVSQNRQSYISSLREELHLQINLRAEEEITKTLKLLVEIRKKMGITEKDPELDEMLERINTGYIEKSLVEQMSKANTTITSRITNKLKSDFPDILGPITHK